MSAVIFHKSGTSISLPSSLSARYLSSYLSAAAEISKTNRILAAEKAERKKRTTADKKSKRQVKQSSANANSTDAAITQYSAPRITEPSAQLAGRAKGAAMVAHLK